MKRNILYDVFTDKTIAFEGLSAGSPTYVTLTRVPPKSGPMEGLGKARIRAEYTTTDDGTYPKNASVIDFSSADKIQRAMQAHSDVATLLFLSLPALGGIAGSTPAAEPAVVAPVADNTAALQAKVDAAEEKAEDLQKELDAATASAEAARKEKEAAEAKLAAQAGEIGRLQADLAAAKAVSSPARAAKKRERAENG